MRRQALLWVLSALGGFVCLVVVRADVPLTVYRNAIQCDSAVFYLTTACLVDQSSNLTECAEQSLSFVRGRDGRSTAVALGTRSSGPTVRGRRMLDGWVAQWACIRSTPGQDYLLLLYGCRGLGDRCAMLVAARNGRMSSIPMGDL